MNIVDRDNEIKRQARNETIDELCDWLDGCIESVNHDTETYKACSAMVKAMRGKKTTGAGTDYAGPR